jgi:hypothetical protein
MALRREWTDSAFPVLDPRGFYSTSGACSVSPFTTMVSGEGSARRHRGAGNAPRDLEGETTTTTSDQTTQPGIPPGWVFDFGGRCGDKRPRARRGGRTSADRVPTRRSRSLFLPSRSEEPRRIIARPQPTITLASSAGGSYPPPVGLKDVPSTLRAGFLTSAAARGATGGRQSVADKVAE